MKNNGTWELDIDMICVLKNITNGLDAVSIHYIPTKDEEIT